MSEMSFQSFHFVLKAGLCVYIWRHVSIRQTVRIPKSRIPTAQPNFDILCSIASSFPGLSAPHFFFHFFLAITAARFRSSETVESARQLVSNDGQFLFLRSLD